MGGGISTSKTTLQYPYCVKLTCMDANQLVLLAGKLAAGEFSADEFLRQVSELTGQSEIATVDVDRAARCGFPEVIFGTGKSSEAIIEIAGKLLKHGQHVLATPSM